MTRLLVAAAAAAVLLATLPLAAADARPITPRHFCLDNYETRFDEESGTDLTAYWVPMVYDIPEVGEVVQDLSIQSLQGCISTVARGLNDLRANGAIPADRLSFPAAYSQCILLEEMGLEWPYSFYENPDYTAHNRAQCAHFLLAFHSRQLPPGSPPIEE